MGYIDTVAFIETHGTPQGFAEGCKTHLCPANFACFEVAAFYRSDFNFRTRFDSGMTAEQIFAEDEERENAERQARLKAMAKLDRKNAKPRVYAEHGTRAGYNSRDFRCRRGSACPNEAAGGISCAEAQRLYIAKRRGVIDAI